MRLKPLFLASLWALSAAFPATSHAWGNDGHQIVAALAERELKGPARDAVNRLLALEPGETLVSISNWADEHRNPSTAQWHYVNFPKNDCNYDQQRDCPDGRCVVEAINRQAAVLQSDQSDARKLIALKYLVHFVADVHQPLHAGYAEDRGGNSYQLQAFMRGSNLHALWDTGMIKYLTEAQGPMLPILKIPQSSLHQPWEAKTAAQESCAIVGTPDFYPARSVGADYIDRYEPVLKARLALAGGRLAELLNRVAR